MNAKLAALLADRKPSRRGVHGTALWSTPEHYYVAQLDRWAECGISWVKIVAGGDSQQNFVTALNRIGSPIIPIIRFYKTDCPANTVAPDLVKPYVDEGVLLFESPFNEFYADYENSWHKALPVPSIPDWPQQVAHGWGLFADAVLRAGGVPTTPAIESWKYADIFEPLFAVLATTYKDLLKQSVIAMHNRTLNHPVNYVKDTGGYLGWRAMDRYVFDRLGEHIPLIATEAGPEPGWDMDSTFPAVSPAMHAIMWRDILSYPVPDYYLADCGWLWHDDGTFTDASWVGNRKYAQGGDLPVIKLLTEWHGDVPDIPDEPADPTIPAAQLTEAVNARMALFAWGQKHAWKMGYLPFGDEVSVMASGVRWYAQPARKADGSLVLLAFKAGEYEAGKTVEIAYKL